MWKLRTLTSAATEETGVRCKNKQKTKISGWSKEHFKQKTLYIKEDTIIQMRADTDLEGQAHSEGRFIHCAAFLKHEHASSCTPPTPSLAEDDGGSSCPPESEQMLRGPGSTLMLRFWSLCGEEGGWGSQVCLAVFIRKRKKTKNRGQNPAPVSHLSTPNNHNQLYKHPLIVNAV